jgi:hypothetical protein
MSRCARILPLAAVLLAFGLSPRAAAAEPLNPCTGNAVSLATYGPCIHAGGVLLSNVTATVNGIDVSRSQQLSMTTNWDAHPPEAQWLLFNVPVAGDFEYRLTPSSPLVVTYTMTAPQGGSLSLLDIALLNKELGGYTAGAEFLFSLDDGRQFLETPGMFNDLDRFTRIVPPFTWVDVRVRLFGDSPGGGPAVGLFVGQAEPAPIPEPATMTLLGTGLAYAFARTRRARKRA